ncbi:GntR family transcriptional regulator [Streptomyces prunicolor]|uniref:GntR family transcriptional regulator n=1 Tax=Streptomyces prunicolor TaxID=67348 RepID=UPI0009963178|nr:GntR family transcriptional regulator [Streptomyces prunicolor]
MKRGPYAEPGHPTPGCTSDEPSQKTSTAPGPQWQKHLKDLPEHYEPGSRISISDRAKYRKAISRARQDGGTVRAIADFLGRSYGFVYRYGGDLREVRPGIASDASRVAEIIRSRIADGTYKAYEVIPDRRTLSTELQVSKDTLDIAVDRLSEEGFLLRISRAGTVSTDPQNLPIGPFIEVRARSGQWKMCRTPRKAAVRDIRNTIIDRIKKGTYPTGNKFPTVRELAGEFDVPVATIHETLEPLKESGVLACTNIARHGTQVNPSALILLKETAE